MRMTYFLKNHIKIYIFGDILRRVMESKPALGPICFSFLANIRTLALGPSKSQKAPTS